MTEAPELFGAVAAAEAAARALVGEAERVAAAGVEVERRLVSMHLHSDPMYMCRQRNIEQLALTDAMARGRSNDQLFRSPKTEVGRDHALFWSVSAPKHFGFGHGS